MTYSHNRIAANRNNAERYAHGTSPPNQFFGNGSAAGMHSNRKSNQNRGAWQRTSVNNSTISTSRCVSNGNPMLSPAVVSVSPTSNVMIATRPAGGGGGGSGRHSSISKSNNPNNFNHHQRTNGVQALSGAGPVTASAATGLFGRVSPISALPTITHFAGSKCFDAPAPTALPKPPQHWTSTSGSSCDPSSLSSSHSGPIPMTRRSQVAPQTSSHQNYYQAAIKSARRALLDDFGTHNLKLLLNVQS